MSNKLKKLISYYKAERASLALQLSECMAESDYSMAGRFSKALVLAERKLQTFYNLGDRMYDEK